MQKTLFCNDIYARVAAKKARLEHKEFLKRLQTNPVSHLQFDDVITTEHTKLKPLFKINHTCAMLRANINRLFRRTWCTTKRPEMLKNHLDIYLHFHNKYLLKY
jgi:hypothetical protein